MNKQHTHGKNRAFLLLIFCFIFSAFELNAQNFTVTSNADSGPNTLREAVSLAVDGDIIEFNIPSAVELLSPITINNALTFNGPAAIAAVGGTEIFIISQMVSPVVCNEVDFTIGGVSSSGNAVCLYDDSSLSLYDCRFVSCLGSIFAQNAQSLTIDKCIFQFNNSEETIVTTGSPDVTISNSVFDFSRQNFFDASGVSFTNCNFINCEGAMTAVNGSSVTVDTCEFPSINNRPAITLLSQSDATISNCNFDANISSSPGAILVLNAALSVKNCECKNSLGAISASNASTFQVEDSTFDSNQVVSAITVNNTATATISNTTFTGNSSLGQGSALLLTNTTMSVSDSLFHGNVSINEGGAIASTSGSTLSLSNCLFEQNRANVGGALYTTGSATITDSTFQNNMSTISGGAIVNNGALYIESSTLNANQSVLFGGGIFENGSQLTITNSTLYGNSVSSMSGGALYQSGASCILLNTTVTANSANTQAGGIDAVNPCALLNTIVAANTSQNVAPDVAGVFTSNGFNFIGIVTAGAVGIDPADKTFATTQTTIQDLVETAGMPPVALLQDNQGPTKTVALVEGSPAIDGGDDQAVVGIDFDQRGPGFPRITRNSVDIGSFEFREFTLNERVEILIECILDLSLPKGIEQSFLSKLFTIQVALKEEPQDIATACQELTAFINNVNAITGKKITPANAANLIDKAQVLRSLLGCSEDAANVASKMTRIKRHIYPRTK